LLFLLKVRWQADHEVVGAWPMVSTTAFEH